MNTVSTYKKLLESVLNESTGLRPGRPDKLEWKKVANSLVHDLGGGESIEIAEAGGDYYLLYFKDGKHEQIGYKEWVSAEVLMQKKMAAKSYLKRKNILIWSKEKDMNNFDVLAWRSGKSEDLVITLGGRNDNLLQSIDSRGKREFIDVGEVSEMKTIAKKYAKDNGLL